MTASWWPPAAGPCSTPRRARIAAAGPAVWLRATADTIERQILADATTQHRRPDLTAAGGRREIEEMLALREPIYRQVATVTVDIDGRPIGEIVEEIVAALPAGSQERRGP